MLEERIRLEQRDEAEHFSLRQETGATSLGSGYAKGKHTVLNDELVISAQA